MSKFPSIIRSSWLPEKTFVIYTNPGKTRTLIISPDIDEDIVEKLREMLERSNNTQRIMNLFSNISV